MIFVEVPGRGHVPFLDEPEALAAIAATTQTLLLGTGITLVAQRDPIWLAKQVASLDVISNGRVIFGVGYGWNKEEMANHGVAYVERRAILREKILMRCVDAVKSQESRKKQFSLALS